MSIFLSIFNKIRGGTNWRQSLLNTKLNNMNFLSGTSRFLLSCFVIVSLISCKPSTESGASDQPYNTSPNAAENIALVQKFIDAQMMGDGETMRALTTDDFFARNPVGDTLTIDEYATTWEALSTRRNNQDAGVFATNSQTVTEGPLSGEWVMFWGTYTAVDNESKEALEVLWHADFRIKDGKISRSVFYFDMVDEQANADSDT